MSKKIKILLLMFVFILLTFYTAFATNEMQTMSTFENNTNNNSLEEPFDDNETRTVGNLENSEDDEFLETTSNTQTLTTDSSTKVTGVNPIASLPEANLGLNNILSILLIAIGILLILFAIAILIRLKR